MRKLIQISWRLAVVIVLLLMLVYFILLHTHLGAKWVLHYVTQNSDLTIQSLEGTLANQLQLSGVTFQQQDNSVNIAQLSYKIERIDWFKKRLVVDSLHLSQLEIGISQVPTDNPTSSVFTGINLPFAVQIKQLIIADAVIESEAKAYTIKQIELAFNAKNQTIVIDKLAITQQNFTASSTGVMQLTAALPFKLTANWNIFDNDNKLAGEGDITGNLAQIQIHQSVKIEQGLLLGDFNLKANIGLDAKTPLIDASLSSDRFMLHYPQQPAITLESFHSQITGWIDAYHISSDFQLLTDKIATISVNLRALGHPDSIDIKELTINNASASLKLPTQLRWKNGLTAVTQVELTAFNPAFYLPGWPGDIDATATLSSGFLSNGELQIAVANAHFFGFLKQQEFAIFSDATISSNEVNINQLQLTMGEDTIKANGTINPEKINLDFNAIIDDLSALDKQLSGSIHTKFNLEGTANNPKINAQVQVKNTTFQDYHLDSLDVTVAGNWLGEIILQASAKQIKIKDEPINSIVLALNGNKDKHYFNVNIDTDTLSSEFFGNGSFAHDSYAWQGQIEQHKITLTDINSSWQLQDTVKIAYPQALDLSLACWLNHQTNSEACLQFKSDVTDATQHLYLTLKGLNVKVFRPFMPNNLTLSGELNGMANIHLLANEVNIESDLSLLDGSLEFLVDAKQAYKSKILTATLQAKKDNQGSKIDSIVELDDGTTLNVQLNLFNSSDQQMAIKGQIDGHFTNTAYLSTLTDEIEQASGDFNIKGSIEGALNNLTIELEAQQNQGYVLFARSQSTLKNMHLQVHKQTNKDLQFSLDATAEKGQLNSQGQISFDTIATDSAWQLQAKVAGDNIRLLTLPELQLDISPKLNITADKKGAHISGEIKIPSGWVKIKQLPDSVISPSADVVINQDTDKHTDTYNYALSFDVVAQIEDKIKVDVMGLNSDLTGNLRLSQIENSAINAYGTLQLVNGQYTIYGQKLDISKGEFIFNGAIDNPNLDVLASRKSLSGEVTAGVALAGTINNLQSSLYSEPALTDLEILSYIISGRGLNEESNANGQQLAQAAILLGLKKSSPIFAEIQSSLGIDVFTIKEGQTANDSLVEAGKNFNQNLYVGYNQGLFNRVGFWVLKYHINKALRLQTTQGENQSVDLIYLRKKK